MIFAYLLNFCLALGAFECLNRVLEKLLVRTVTRSLGHSVVVLSGQKTRGQGGPDSGAVFELFIERCIFNFESLSVEGVVLRLLSDRC